VQTLIMKPLGGKVLSGDEHRDVLRRAGYAEVEVHQQGRKGWICAVARRPVTQP
jgi:hypothetical protein